MAARFPLCVLLAVLGAGLACEPGCGTSVESDPLAGFLTGEAQRKALCARGRENAVTALFCGEKAPDLTSLVEFEDALHLGFKDAARPRFALTGNSSSLLARSVSAINPRAVLAKIPNERDDANFAALGYERGDALVEMAVRPPSGQTSLYLLRYTQPCDADKSCSFEDRLTPGTEKGWTGWSLYDDHDLKNTIFDCLACHQPKGPGTSVDFRMQEFQNPWTHWIAAFGDGELALFHDYANAHGPDEDFAGIPAHNLVAGNPIDVETFFKQSGSVEPNPFPSQIIEDEVKASSPGQPADNSVPGHSATWDALYDRAVHGEVFPPPYHDVKITDAAKLANMTAAYHQWQVGTLQGPLPDIRDVIRDDALAELSFRPKPGLSGKEILVHMCSQCHNSRLDQHLTRARFDPAALDTMSRAEKDLAISRLKLTEDDRFRMPPHLMRDLSDDEIAACVTALGR